MKNALLLKTAQMVLLPILGAFGAWLMMAYPAIHTAFCTAS